MSLAEYARKELALLSGDEPDEQQAMMNDHLIRMVEAFADEGHSGFSAAYAISLLTKLLRFEPLTPLTGDDSEWNDVSGYGPDADMRWQNNRCFHVFKRADGTAYDGNAVVFRYPDGTCVSRRESNRDITFPYVPTREYVDVPPEAA